MSTYIWQRRLPDGTFDLWREDLVGSVVPQEGIELEINGRPWRVIHTVPARDTICVMLEEVVHS